MLNDEPKRKSIWLIIILGILLLAAGSGYYLQSQRSRDIPTIDTEAILKQSVLQNRNFTTDVQKMQAGDMSAYLVEEHSVPLVYISFAFKNAGSAHEEQAQQGLTAILAEMLTNGAGKYSALKFKNLCAEYGIKIGFGADKDYFTGFLAVPSDNLPLATEILQAVLSEPHFAEKYLEISKEQRLKAIQMQAEKLQSVLSDEFASAIYAGHPYSRKSLGEAEQIIDLQADDLRAYMHNKLAQNNLLVGISGDITAEQAQKAMLQAFGNLPKQTSEQDFSRLQIATDGDLVAVEHDAAQSIMRFAVQGTYRDASDFYPLYIANYVFGESGLNSRLSKVIREENGLTYGIYTFLSIRDASALLEGYFSATPENVTQVRNLLQQEWQKMAEKGITAQELQQAKDALLAAYHLRFSSLASIADMLVSMQQYNLGQDFLQKRNEYIRAVTLSEVNAAAKKYYGQTPNYVIIGPQIKEYE